MKTSEWIKFFLQYLLSPVLILLIGAYLNYQSEQQRQSIEKIQIAEKIISESFSGNRQKTYALDKLMHIVIDVATADSISAIIASYTVAEDITLINTGHADKVIDNQKQATISGGVSANIATKKLEANEKFQTFSTKYTKATTYEKQGFKKLETDPDSALIFFQKAEKTYPTLHSNNEISNELKRVKDNNPFEKKKIANELMKKYRTKDDIE